MCGLIMVSVKRGLLIPTPVEDKMDIMNQLLGVLAIILQVNRLDGGKHPGIFCPLQKTRIFLQGAQHEFQTPGIGFLVKQG